MKKKFRKRKYILFDRGCLLIERSEKLEKLYHIDLDKKPSSKHYKRTAIIYGATAAGIVAAVQLKRDGIDSYIVEPTSHIGGMTTGGLSATDLGSEHAVGGLAKEFYREVSEYYEQEKMYLFEPKIASEILGKWIDSHHLTIFTQQQISHVTKKNNKIKSIEMMDGTVYEGSYFIDTTYEGDLMALAGVSYVVGREANSTYQEVYNGIQFKEQHHKFESWIDPYVEEGNPESGLLYGIQDIPEKEIGYNGKADSSIQAYNFRICLTNNPKNRVPFPKPDDYDESRYELLKRYILKGHWDALNLNTPLPNQKFDLNNYGAISTDLIGKNYGWPEGNYSEREIIFQEHLSYSQGMLYFLSNHEEIPEEIRLEVSQFGLPADEYVDNNHWSPQLYIREARRMISDYVMTDKNCLGLEEVEDAVALASYHMDSHNCRRLVLDGRVVNEGDVQVPISPFGISYRSIVPPKGECRNLFAPLSLSSSHIAFGSIRMEPVFMMLGQSAAIALHLCQQNDQDVQELEYDELKKQLVKESQVVEWDQTIEDDPIERMQETFGKS